MAGKQEPIRTRAFVHVGGELVDIDSLTAEQRSFVGAHLRVAMLNAAYEGRAVFWAEGLPERFPEEKD